MSAHPSHSTNRAGIGGVSQGTVDATVAIVDELARRLEQMEADQVDLIQSNLQHLRELAVLNRMADSLNAERGFEHILRDAAREARDILGSEGAVWMMEPDRDGQLRRLFTADGEMTDINIPAEVGDLFERVVREQPDSPLSMPHYNPEDDDGLYLALPAATHRHLVAVLVVHSKDIARLTDSQYTRLLQSMLRQMAVACENARLFDVLSEMVIDVVVAMALAVESRDPYTGGHVERVTAYALMLAGACHINDQQLSVLRIGGLLHDIGKIAVPDAILRKPGKLDPEEFRIMQTHAAVGHQIVSPIPQLAPATPVIRWHHERFDGRGYPDGLKGYDIPLLARVTAVADTFDAMTSDRPYRKGMPVETALAEIQRCSGTQFDPELAELFLKGGDDRFAAAITDLQHWRRRKRDGAHMGLAEFLDLHLPKALS
ncbi:MAG: HD domain-containing protein [Phycisphaeraceae bacterium]|nr:HD domain-containing protein [Phycisphaeraceae bacterium]